MHKDKTLETTITYPDGRSITERVDLRGEINPGLFSDEVEHWLRSPDLYFRHGGEFS